MVMAMTPTVRCHRMERLPGAFVVTAAVEIAGSRHEVLPPRRSIHLLRAAPP